MNSTLLQNLIYINISLKTNEILICMLLMNLKKGSTKATLF